MEERIRWAFFKEFKDDAIRQVVDGGKRTAQVARDIGIREGLWVAGSVRVSLLEQTVLLAPDITRTSKKKKSVCAKKMCGSRKKEPF